MPEVFRVDSGSEPEETGAVMARSRILVTLVLVVLVLALAALPAAAQTTTQTPGGGSAGGGSISATGNVNTGPGAALTSGGGAAAPAVASPGVLSPSEGGHDEFAEEPLPDTGGGEIAIAVGSLLTAGGLGLRYALKR
jgi:hypothetical protein